jgi:exopolysaccharide biosynthesis polyprenyl glycosylphosphotransferase
MRNSEANHRPGETAIPRLVEFILSSAVICAMMKAADPAASLPDIIGALPDGGIAMVVVFAVVAGAVTVTAGFWHPQVRFSRDQGPAAAALLAATALGVLLFIGNNLRSGFTGINPLFMAKMLAVWLSTMTLIRLAYGFAVPRLSRPRRILLLGDRDDGGAIRLRLRSRLGRGFDPIVPHGNALSRGPLHQQHIWQQRIWAVVVASQPDPSTAEQLLDCKLRGIRIFSAAAFHEKHLGRIDLDALTVNDLMFSEGFATGRISAAVKRLCDLVIGACMLILLLPLMALTAVAIKIDSTGPVFYRQERVGQFGGTFTLFKFRSMTADAEANGDPLWAQKRDPRVTRIGRFIRASRIDELPQLVNVLRGEMSLVGPRPERPHFVVQLARAIPFYRQRAYVKPGLTGWAQVNFPYGASVEDAREKLAYDLYYVKNRTILLDLTILIATIRVVLSREGAR